jgi:hypothetical protein
MYRRLLLVLILPAAGCSWLPQIAHQPSIHNPFPQLSKVAVAPFFNLSNEPTVDGRRVAMAYYNELQVVPGFEVVPVGVVEGAIRQHNLPLRGPEDARRLAQILDVDAVIIGAVTDYSPYYPPRVTLQTEWYAANPCFHPIPPGYGLPWGTRDEADIPGPLIFEAEMALARAQLATQTPVGPPMPEPIPAPQPEPADASAANRPAGLTVHSDSSAGAAPPAPSAQSNGSLALAGGGGTEPWPDPRGFVPPPPSRDPPPCRLSNAPVLKHTRTYHGNDGNFTEALQSYYFFREDARFGGWQGYLQRSEDFLRFCCHMHIAEMLTARGGSGETRVVWRWPTIR